MQPTEEAVVFSAGQGATGETLVGVLSRPQVAAGTGVVIVVGGPQYRGGSHRQFVLLARALAQAGHAVLRFDYGGMGDSTGAQKDFLGADDDIAAAIDQLHARVPSLRRTVLWGLCDGASAALLYLQATQDPRVQGLCLLNPWVRSETSLARTQVKHYYSQRLRQPEFWAKLFTGKVARGAVGGLFNNLRTALGKPAAPSDSAAVAELPFQTRMALAWRQFQGPILLVLSGDDYTAKEFTEYVAADTAWAGVLRHARLQRHVVADADHTFSHRVHRLAAEALTLDWLTQMKAMPVAEPEIIDEPN